MVRWGDGEMGEDEKGEDEKARGKWEDTNQLMPLRKEMVKIAGSQL
jgi:hypothetical protein